MASPEERDAKGKLDDFILNVNKDLDTIVSKIDLFVEDKELQPLITRAWKEVQPKFEQMRYSTKTIDLKHLQERGLVGTQLYLKLAVYDKRRKEFYDWLGGMTTLRSGKPGWKRLGGGILGKLWDIIDTILRSLGIPGADAVGEFKDTVKASSED